MTSLEQEFRRGEQARRLLEDPLLKEAFAVVDASLRDQWAATLDDAIAERERMWLMLKVLGRVRASLVSVLETGKLAVAELDRVAAKR